MAKEHLGRYANTFDALAQVLRQEGAAALLTGLAPTLWRNCIWNG
jgi:solute carrier family 25 2-oxodicarboxylate transporter 21